MCGCFGKKRDKKVVTRGGVTLGDSKEKSVEEEQKPQLTCHQCLQKFDADNAVWCEKCKTARYCCESCKSVHWNQGGHKDACAVVHQRRSVKVAEPEVVEEPEKKISRRAKTSPKLGKTEDEEGTEPARTTKGRAKRVARGKSAPALGGGKGRRLSAGKGQNQGKEEGEKEPTRVKGKGKGKFKGLNRVNTIDGKRPEFEYEDDDRGAPVFGGGNGLVMMI